MVAMTPWSPHSENLGLPTWQNPILTKEIDVVMAQLNIKNHGSRVDLSAQLLRCVSSWDALLDIVDLTAELLAQSLISLAITLFV
jgi:hypothetical protein